MLMISTPHYLLEEMVKTIWDLSVMILEIISQIRTLHTVNSLAFIGCGKTANSRLGKRLERDDLKKIFSEYDIILPKKTTALLGSVYEDYDHWNYAKDLDLCEEVIGEQCPEYLDSYKKVVNGKDLYYYNMFIAPKKLIDPYCEWVFPILAEVEKRVDMTGYDDYQKRIYGFLTERLFDVCMDKQDLKVKECELKVNGLRLNAHMWIVKKHIVRWGYVHIYMGLFHKNMRR